MYIAGPGFNAGRYGLACGATTAVVTERLKIPAVTGLYTENPGTDLYKDRAYILQTENNAAKMKEALERLAGLHLVWRRAVLSVMERQKDTLVLVLP